MQAFLEQHRASIVERWMATVRQNLGYDVALTDQQIVDSFHLFVDQVLEGLQQHGGELLDRENSAIARMHGSHRQKLQRPIDQLVREYGLFYGAVLETAAELGESLSLQDCAVLSECLNIGAAQAVREYEHQHIGELHANKSRQFAFMAHELRNPLSSAVMAWSLVRQSGEVKGMPADALSQSLGQVVERIDNALVELRLSGIRSGAPLRVERIAVASLVDDALRDSSAVAVAKAVQLTSESHDPGHVEGDRRLLLSALTNIVRNAVKFTKRAGCVRVRARRSEGQVLISVEDECGGLPPQRAEHLFEAFEQSGQDRSGFGLGLAIARQAIEAHGGGIAVEDRPHVGCTFTISLNAA